MAALRLAEPPPIRAAPPRGARRAASAGLRTLRASARPLGAAPLGAAGILALQSSAGNAAVQRLLGAYRPGPGRSAAAVGTSGASLAQPHGAAVPARPTVSRCGPDNPGCGCSPEEKEAAAVQRRDPFEGLPTLGPDPFAAPARLRFTERSFLDGSLPTVCPRCHREAPTLPLPPRYVDKDATEPRLVTWGQESESALNHAGTVRVLQLDPGGVDRVVDDYGVGLTKRITSSHEFEGSDALRADGAETMRRRWPDIRPVVRDKLVGYYQGELGTAVGMTPKWASPLLEHTALQSALTTKLGGRAPLGRWNAEATPGQRYGIFVIHDIGNATIWFTLPDRPLWLYTISTFDFVRHDPFVAEVTRQVYDNTRWIQHVMPLLLKVGAFGLSFSGNVAFVILGIALDELATEMQADADGRPGRSVDEILTSAGTQLLVDRLFHHLLGGGGASSAAAGAGKAAVKAERIAERAAPLVRKELAAADKPLVKDALEAGTARKVTDATAKAEGHSVEVAVTSAGETHLYRLGRGGTWCRLSTPVCGLDLGADVAAAAASPKSFTRTALEDTRALMAQVGGEISFLGRVYERMRAAGRVDLSLLSGPERAMLDDLVPTGDASKLTLSQLRDMPRSLGLKGDFAKAADAEARLVKQLYREGRPLYETLRAASPSFAARSRVLGESWGRDAVTSLPPRTGALHVDHVVPLNEIIRMPGFDKLRPERQLEIVNDVRNLRAIDSAANLSKGDRAFSDWPQAAVYYDPAGLARMRALEEELRTYLSGRIAALGRP